MGLMSKIQKPWTFSAGATIVASEHNDNFDTAFIDYDGNITNYNFNASAGIVDTKLGSITTAGKVNLTALSIAGQTAGDILYASSPTVLTRIPIGTAGQKLKVFYDTYTKLMAHADGTDGLVSFVDEAGKTITNTATYDTYTKVCSHFDGADNAVAYTDPIAGAYTFQGHAHLHTGEKKFGTASLALDGIDDYVTLPDSASWDFGTGDFTIDFQINPTFLVDRSHRIIVGQKDDATHLWYVGIREDTGYNQIIFYNNNGGSEVVCQSGTSGPIEGSWNHCAVVRSGTNLYIFIDGLLKATTDVTGWTAQNLASVLGVGNVGLYGLYKGYIDELRISKGIARWTGNFTKPAYPYGQVVISTAQKVFGTASGYFDGCGSYLSLDDSDDWNMGTENFAIDFRFYVTSWGDTFEVLCAQCASNAAAASRQNEIDIDTVNHRIKALFWDTSATPTWENSIVLSPPHSVELNTWYHVAVVRNGNVLTMYINGVAQPNPDDLTGVTLQNSAEPFLIGRLGYTTPYNFNGYIDEFRISKGIARWTTDFTVPSTAYSPVPMWVTP